MFNTKAERAVLSGQWEVDVKYGIQYLSAYLEGHTAKSETNPFVLINRDGSVDESESLNGQIRQGAIAHFLISGAMMLEDGACSYGIRNISQRIAAADAKPEVSGILIECNSGGGESAAGTVLLNTLLDVRSRNATPVAVYTQLMCSAAVRGLMAANYIVAAGTTVDVGSVGTYVSIDKELLEDLKKKTLTVYARQSTLKNRDIRDLMEGDTDALEEWVSLKAQGFIDDVERVRTGMRRTTEQFKRMQAGDIFTAAEAASFGLIDTVGTMADAVSFLRRRTN